MRDVNIACTRWLLKNDPEYRANYQQYEVTRDRRDARAQGAPDHELPHSKRFTR